jgi:type II secretory pathway component PulC
MLLMAAALIVFGAAPAAAQQASPSGQAARTTVTQVRSEDPKLIFEREVFSYPAENRRDPFKPLGKDASGPLFEDLTLRMIIHSEVAQQSVVVLADGAKKTYRLRRGETVGNATVVQIAPTRVVFAVEDYGNRRQEVLELRPNKEEE